MNVITQYEEEGITNILSKFHFIPKKIDDKYVNSLLIWHPYSEVMSSTLAIIKLKVLPAWTILNDSAVTSVNHRGLSTPTTT